MWKTVKLGDICELIGGGTPSKKNASYYGGEIPWATVRDMHSDELSETELQITELGLQQSSSKVIPANNIVIASRVGLGKVCLLNQDTAINQDLRGVIPKHSNTLDVRYLFHWFKSIAQTIISAGRGATVHGVTLPFLKSLELPLPPLAEQQRIVAKLDAAFAEIDRAVESYEDSVSNAKDCLSKVRASRVTEVLSSSQTAKLGSLASLKNGLNYNKSEKGYSVKILGVGDFGNRFSIGTEDLKVIETNSPVSTDYHLEHGDIVFVRSNGNKQLIGRSIVIENPSEPATFSGFCIRCRIETADMSPLFLCHYLKSSVVRDKLISEGGGANISNLNQKMLADIDVPLLSQHEQISLIRWIEELEKSFEDFVATLIKRVQLADNLKSAILAQELQPPQSEAA